MPPGRRGQSRTSPRTVRTRGAYHGRDLTKAVDDEVQLERICGSIELASRSGRVVASSAQALGICVSRHRSEWVLVEFLACF